MQHLLDNPIYYALNSSHHNFAKGAENAKFYKEDMAAFAGLKTNSFSDFEKLYQLSQSESVFVIFSILPLKIPKQWELLTDLNMYQMVFEGENMPIKKDIVFADLREENVAEMIALVDLTKPGPFLNRTIDFGNYTGIFQNKKLVAMAGHRFNLSTYCEISAVCTHPDYLGNGYASILLHEQIRRITARQETPFLHVRKDNEEAVKLYQKIGFNIRTDMSAYVIKKI